MRFVPALAALALALPLAGAAAVELVVGDRHALHLGPAQEADHAGGLIPAPGAGVVHRIWAFCHIIASPWIVRSGSI